MQGRGPWQLVTVLDADGWAEGSDPIASTLIHRSAALQATIGVDAALFSAGTETHSVVLFKESTGRADHAQVLVHYQLELAKRSGRAVHRIILGTSEGFARPRELADAYRQSRQAAQAAAVDPQLGELVDCRATGIYQLLASAGGGAGAWADAGSVYFRILEDHDRNHELLPVLELFYDNDGSVQEVADKLHLHRSSIYNRLGRIRQLLGVDPLKGMVRLELHAALKARRWAGRPRNLALAFGDVGVDCRAGVQGGVQGGVGRCFARRLPRPFPPVARNPAVHPHRHSHKRNTARHKGCRIVQPHRGSEDAGEHHGGNACHNVPPSELTHNPSVTPAFPTFPRRAGIVV